MSSLQSILKQYWGYQSFRPLQEEIIQSLLDGKDTLALLPTGGGKSICFQVPAMAREGLCLVISPLIALMKDQVENLRKKNITSFAIYSGQTRKEVHEILRVAGNSNCKFLYVSPERLETRIFLEYLPSLEVSMIAVDEAHCISQWGYDFRPPYLRIASLREELPGVPVLALTASATPGVQEDICTRLNFKEPRVFRQSFERPNLSYSVFEADSKINRIVEILSKVPGTAIVYCKSRKRTREISDLLNMHSIRSGFYHAGLSNEERANRQEAWINNELRVVACTNAFGMGIDKPDVRVVIHADVPDSLENYYQEAGRAGRDGNRAYAVLLYNDKEVVELKEMPDKRYPPVARIREVYQMLMNYLQLPSGAGEGQSFDFDLGGFIKQSGLNSLLVTATLKTLEQEEILQLNEQVFLPATVQFVADKRRVYEFEEQRPDLEPLIKTLLRTYEGIFDQAVYVNEKMIARLIRQHDVVVTESLNLLHQNRIIEYKPQKDKPQLFFLQNRMRTEDLHINAANYFKRKETYAARIRAMLQYLDSGQCRSKLIGEYFGDNEMRNCGICDFCLARKKKSLSSEEFNLIHKELAALIKSGRHTTFSLPGEMKHIKKQKLLEVLNFLQSENKIRVDEKGVVTMVKE